ncbi:MAG: FliM/FliN family flagellar motor switch protein [Vicinamibacterales bacterium]
MSSSPTSSSSSEALAALPFAPMLDVQCHVDFVIGTTRMTVRDCLALGKHSMIRLGQTAGADFDLRVHGVSVAQGEVAVVDDNATVRVTRITIPTGVGWE